MERKRDRARERNSVSITERETATRLHLTDQERGAKGTRFCLSVCMRV